MKINFNAKSLLALLTVISILAWIGGTFFQTVNPEIGKEIVNIGFPVFIVCFGIWLIFIFLTLARNIKRL